MWFNPQYRKEKNKTKQKQRVQVIILWVQDLQSLGLFGALVCKSGNGEDNILKSQASDENRHKQSAVPSTAREGSWYREPGYLSGSAHGRATEAQTVSYC
jgi:hypothetical protein